MKNLMLSFYRSSFWAACGVIVAVMGMLVGFFGSIAAINASTKGDSILTVDEHGWNIRKKEVD